MDLMTRKTIRGGALALAVGIAACGPAAAPAGAPTAAQQPPPPLPERPLEFPEFREMTLPNGLPVIVIEHGTQPLINVALYVRSGTAAEPAAQAGLAGMTAELLTKGTPTRTASQIAETIEGVGGELNASAGLDWLTVSTTVLAEHMPLAFELVADVTQRPTFPEQEVQVTRRRTLSGLQAELGQPGTIAERRFQRELYGPDHPYGVSPIPGTVEAITRDQIAGFHRQHFAADNALLVVSGAVRADQVEALARQHFAGWRHGAPAAARLPQPPAVDRTRISLVHRPGSVQSNIRIGHLAIRPDSPDYFPLLVLNNIVGGGTDARLFQILREQRGWTYGAYSRLTRPLDVGVFAAQAEVRTEVTDSALVEMIRQLNLIRDERVPDAEFEAAKSFLAGSFPLRIETPGQVAGQIAQARLLGLPTEDVTRYRERILAITQDDVQRVARQHVRPDRASIVVVGDAARILGMLEPIAPVTLFDVEGRPLERAAIEVRGAEVRFDGTRLRPQTLVYQFMVQGNPMGTATEQLRREGDVWVATSRLESPMLRQESEVRFGATDLSPRMARLNAQQGPVQMSVNVEVADGRLRGRAELPEQAGGARDIDAPAVEGMLLPGMDAHVLTVADVREGQSITLPVFNTMTASVTNVTYRVTGTETVTVPAGTFPAYRVQIEGPQPLTVYVRQQAPHIMLRQEFPGMPISVELQEIR
jgi:zinc protease